jgi:hypothetical protein
VHPLGRLVSRSVRLSCRWEDRCRLWWVSGHHQAGAGGRLAAAAYVVASVAAFCLMPGGLGSSMRVTTREPATTCRANWSSRFHPSCFTQASVSGTTNPLPRLTSVQVGLAFGITIGDLLPPWPCRNTPRCASVAKDWTGHKHVRVRARMRQSVREDGY